MSRGYHAPRAAPVDRGLGARRDRRTRRRMPSVEPGGSDENLVVGGGVAQRQRDRGANSEAGLRPGAGIAEGQARVVADAVEPLALPGRLDDEGGGSAGGDDETAPEQDRSL